MAAKVNKKAFDFCKGFYYLFYPKTLKSYACLFGRKTNHK